MTGRGTRRGRGTRTGRGTKSGRVEAVRRRFGKVQLPVAVGMTLVWMLLFNGFQLREESVGLLVLGFLVSVLIMVLFPLPPITPGFRLRPLSLVRLTVFFIAELAVASFQVTVMVFMPRAPVRSSVVAVPLRTDSDLMLVCTSIALSVIPGSMVVEVGQPDRVLYAHILGADNQRRVEKARRDTWRLETHIVRAFGTRADIADLEAASASGRELA